MIGSKNTFVVNQWINQFGKTKRRDRSDITLIKSRVSFVGLNWSSLTVHFMDFASYGVNEKIQTENSWIFKIISLS